jgi:hypothetical protein
MPRWGVSWGSRLFRIGQSPSGRWWGYFNFMGFRFFRYLDEGGNKRWTRNASYGSTQSPTSVATQQVSQSPTVNSQKKVDWNEIASQDEILQPLENANDSIIEAIRKEVND